jgi:hypothetical protein
MSIAYDSGPPRSARRIASAPSSLLNRIQKPALADRLSKDDSATPAAASTYVIFLLHELPKTYEASCFKEEELQDRSVLDEVGHDLLPGPRRNRKRRRIWIRSWICLWETGRKQRKQQLPRRQLVPPPRSRKQMLKWRRLAPKNLAQLPRLPIPSSMPLPHALVLLLTPVQLLYIHCPEPSRIAAGVRFSLDKNTTVPFLGYSIYKIPLCLSQLPVHHAWNLTSQILTQASAPALANFPTFPSLSIHKTELTPPIPAFLIGMLRLTSLTLQMYTCVSSEPEAQCWPSAVQTTEFTLALC